MAPPNSPRAEPPKLGDIRAVLPLPRPPTAQRVDHPPEVDRLTQTVPSRIPSRRRERLAGLAGGLRLGVEVLAQLRPLVLKRQVDLR